MFPSGSSSTALIRVPTILMFGQSNNDGVFQSTRLANALWNYKGILAGWPATRVAQAQYVDSPSNVHIYDRGALQASDWWADTGVWEAYQAGVNSRNVRNATNTTLFGTECYLSQCIQDVTGGQVAIVKPSFGGTGLLSTTTSVPPGSWNYITRGIAMQTYLARAVRDYAAYNPGHVMDPVAVIWWQGEGDASAGVSTANYQSNWLELYGILRDSIRSLFPIQRDPVWNLVKLDYYRNAAETLINTALSNCAGLIPDGYYITAHTGKSLQKQELTVAQASPLAKGTPTNATGNDDDAHSNYIAGQLVAEEIRDNLVAEGII